MRWSMRLIYLFAVGPATLLGGEKPSTQSATPVIMFEHGDRGNALKVTQYRRVVPSTNEHQPPSQPNVWLDYFLVVRLGDMERGAPIWESWVPTSDFASYQEPRVINAAFGPATVVLVFNQYDHCRIDVWSWDHERWCQYKASNEGAQMPGKGLVISGQAARADVVLKDDFSADLTLETASGRREHFVIEIADRTVSIRDAKRR